MVYDAPIAGCKISCNCDSCLNKIKVEHNNYMLEYGNSPLPEIKFSKEETTETQKLTMDQKWKIAHHLRDEISFLGTYMPFKNSCFTNISQSDVYDIANMVKCVDDDIRAGVDKLQRINDYDNESNEKGYVETPKSEKPAKRIFYATEALKYTSDFSKESENPLLKNIVELGKISVYELNQEEKKCTCPKEVWMYKGCCCGGK